MRDIDSYLIERFAAIFKDDWRNYANCTDVGDDVFFNPDRVDEAKLVCEGCPVRLECFDDAVLFQDEGVRGGFDDKERSAVLAHRRRSNAIFLFDLNEG